ncbi:MAG: polysaccharide biosynthesis protein [Bacteroidetes bacterium]|nr:polysaccharide biosynthesis protein [Bacteroidota bacterium]MBS1973633.1 polysaccharide biosynthesis protein [Bacteroidota bacterium]
MSNLKKLAGETVWYGASSIFARFLYYLLTPYLTYKLTGPGYGEMSLVYAAIPFLNTVFLYGIETAYFRYIQKDEHKNDIYNTANVSIITSTLVFTILLIAFNKQFAHLISIKEHPEYITLSAFIIGCDTLSALPFAKLRQENRPRKFAVIRVLGILANMSTVYFFLSVCPSMQAKNPNSIWLILYNKDFSVGYVLVAGLVQSVLTLLLVSKEWLAFKWHFNFALWKDVMIYSLPLTVAGFAGMINETFDRIMLGWWAPAASEAAAHAEVGTYSACYKLSILITLFIQAFRMGAEPFFFKQSVHEGAQRTYARVMKFFVITITVMFLVVALYLDIWKEFIQNKKMWAGLKVVPILLFANMFLGIYYNLSIWYRLSRKTAPGAYITLIGAAITLLVNYLFIPRFSYMACAWATFLCYGSMMAISYFWGQKVYRIPYATKKLVAYMAIVAMLYFIHHLLTGIWKGNLFSLSLATFFTVAYCLFILKTERKEFQKLPYIRKLV